MDETIEKTAEERAAEENQLRKSGDLEYLATILPRIITAKEKLEKLNMYIEKYADTYMEWQNMYDKKDLEDCTKKMEDIIYRLSSVNKL
ncbi:MAG TPA: hypothetical protein P5056_03355 [Candidatus Paceibacterota bacterium]|nr:hypothetical protein [Candidatus Paceibacterota bacterium]